MKYLEIFFVLISTNLILSDLMAQFPSVPPSIKKELTIKNRTIDGRPISYGISYPKGYEKTREYPALICLTGGGFSKQLAYYYYHNYSPKETFKNHVKIYLIATNGKSLLSYSRQDWTEVMSILQEAENLTPNNWLISGASNGGVATYALISALPKKFAGYITIPGSMGGHQILSEWKDYKVLLVYMDQDYGWIEGTKRDYKKLKEHIKNIELFEIKGYGHILPAHFDIEGIYKKYLAL